VGPIEPQFWALMLTLLGLDAARFEGRNDPAQWPALKAELAAAFRARTRDDWVAVFEGTDACVCAVLSMDEAPRHPHMAARRTFVEREGAIQPAPAPRFSRTASEIGGAPPLRGEHTDAVLQEWGFGAADIAALRTAGAIG
jgi:alpha-methylacyl-CoA racemase